MNPVPSCSVRLGDSGLVALVSPDDFERISAHSWRPLNSGRKVYARADTPRGTVLMHRLLLGVVNRPCLVDHRDGNGLNNVRENIRLATAAQNRWNARPTGAAGFRGVTGSRGYWTAKWRTNGEYRYAGSWPSAIEAALAYNDAVVADRGEHAEKNAVPADEAICILERRLQENAAERERLERWLSEVTTCSSR